MTIDSRDAIHVYFFRSFPIVKEYYIFGVMKSRKIEEMGSYEELMDKKACCMS